MFSDELEKISWEETTRRINAKTDADVRRALSKEHCDVEVYGTHLTGCRPLSGNKGTFKQEVHGRAFRKNDFHVCAVVYYELLYQLVRVLRFPHQQSHAPHHTDGRGDCKRIQGYQEARAF